MATMRILEVIHDKFNAVEICTTVINVMHLNGSLNCSIISLYFLLVSAYRPKYLKQSKCHKLIPNLIIPILPYVYLFKWSSNSFASYQVKFRAEIYFGARKDKLWIDYNILVNFSIFVRIHLKKNWLDDRRSRPGRGWEFFSSPQRPNRLWCPPSLLSNGYQELFPWE
jgi:hypothetical protein